MEPEMTRFIYNGEYYTGEIKKATPELYTPPEPEPEPEPEEKINVMIEEIKEEPVIVVIEEPEPEPEQPAVVITEEPKVDVVVVPVHREKNELRVDKTTKIHLLTFEIVRVRVSPHQSATIDIVIKTDKHELERTASLSGQDYSKWSSDDDYLYDYVRENIDKIY